MNTHRLRLFILAGLVALLQGCGTSKLEQALLENKRTLSEVSAERDILKETLAEKTARLAELERNGQDLQL